MGVFGYGVAFEAGRHKLKISDVRSKTQLVFPGAAKPFVAMVGKLRSFRSQPLVRPTAEATLTAIRDAHRALLARVQDVVGCFDRRGFNAAMFAALFRLANDGALDPFAILERADGETFVYGQDDRP